MPHRYFTTDISGGTAVLSGGDEPKPVKMMKATPHKDQKQ